MNNVTNLDKKTIHLRLHPSLEEASRKGLMQGLEIGECLVFIGEPGQTASKLQASVASSFRGDDNIKKQGLEQQKGFLVFEGEPAIAVTRVTRVRAAE